MRIIRKSTPKGLVTLLILLPVMLSAQQPADTGPSTSSQIPAPNNQAISQTGLLPIYGIDLRVDPSQAQPVQQPNMKSAPLTALSAVNPSVAIMAGVLSHRAKPAKITFVWVLNGNSSRNVGSNPPAFEVSYPGWPGVNPDQLEPVIVKLSPTPQGSYRLVGATRAPLTAEQSTQQDWAVYSSFVEDSISANVQKLGAGHAQVTASSILGPGEYAIALTPVDKSHRFSGEEIEKRQAEGLLISYVWPFSLK